MYSAGYILRWRRWRAFLKDTAEIPDLDVGDRKAQTLVSYPHFCFLSLYFVDFL